jgi:hypothetical protein
MQILPTKIIAVDFDEHCKTAPMVASKKRIPPV